MAGSRPHTLHADSAINAIVYGVADAESYGYNAGFLTNFVHTTYTFSGNGNWSNPANLENGTMPPAILPMDSEIVITGNCTLDVPQTI